MMIKKYKKLIKIQKMIKQIKIMIKILKKIN